MDTISRDFIKDVFQRVKSSTGKPLGEKTLSNYTLRVLTLQKQGFISYLNNPDEMYEKLRQKYSNPSSMLTTIKPTVVFLSHLTEKERVDLKCAFSDELAKGYRDKITDLNRETKNQREQRAKCVQER